MYYLEGVAYGLIMTLHHSKVSAYMSQAAFSYQVLSPKKAGYKVASYAGSQLDKGTISNFPEHQENHYCFCELKVIAASSHHMTRVV